MWSSWLLLAVAGVATVFMVNAFRPVRRNRVLFLPSFFASWLTTELAPVHLVITTAAAVALVWVGALDQWPGWVGAVALLVDAGALLLLVFQGRGTAAAAGAALTGLADDLPEPSVHQIRRIKDVPFSRVAGRVLKLDVFTPVDPPRAGERRPALLQIHGGAWIIGDKREQGIPLLKAMARNGWVGFNANYRLSPGATWPEHLVDVKQALAFIRANAEEYGIDPSFVAVTGGSAGGHITAMMALTANDPDYQPGFEDADTSVQAAVPFYAVYDLTNRRELMSPEFVEWFVEPLIMKAFLDDEPQRFSAASPLDQVRDDAPPFSSSTVTRTRWRRSRTPAPSWTSWVRCPRRPWSTSNCTAPSMRSTPSPPSALVG